MQDNVKEQEREQRVDGYKNLMNKYGTSDDVSEQYRFESDEPVTDVELTLNYEENGLFSKIIDIPADDAVSSGFDYGLNDVDMKNFINDSLDELDFEGKASEAIKWSRLYGGALMVMIIDDGNEMEDPVDWDSIRGIDELLVFERPLVTPDYNSIYNHKPKDRKWSKFGMPEYYDISPIYGSPFRVHESRCLLFQNGKLPQSSSRTEYRFFGMPEYTRIHKALQETITSHGNGVKLLDRAVQAIYKMNDLAQLLETEEGEDIVLRRLRIIDMAKGIINSIAIDANGEDYDYKTVTFSGVKDIIDATCNMLSAVTNIPQTKLFGRSPAGENATGEGDMENYYDFVGKIQKLNLKKNLGTLIDIILIVGKYKGKFEEIPDYVLKFNPLWNLSEAEQAGVDQTKAATELTKAQTAQVYVDMQALDASEVRKRLAENGEFTVNDILDEEEDWNDIQEEDEPNGEESVETSGTALTAEMRTPSPQEDMKMDDIAPTGCGVLVIKDGEILVGERKDSGLLCGPGGHIELGETPEDAAIRETREEFGINIAETIPLTIISGMPEEYCPSQIFLCTEFYGTPIAFNTEMENARFEPVTDILKKQMFLPFELSIRELLNVLHNINRDIVNEDDWVTVNGQHIEVNENGEQIGGNPKVLGKESVANSSGSGNMEIPKDSNGKSYSKPAADNVSPKEAAKVGHEINNVYHTRFKGKRRGVITTYNPDDDRAYDYKFESHGFDEYNIFSKIENER
ncbi:MAG: DUF1073 domain-containing protein [Clostridiaceae bacterium]|nr:DUF1073 domain-containing protein [Clostridiaceae bacterium]